MTARHRRTRARGDQGSWTQSIPSQPSACPPPEPIRGATPFEFYLRSVAAILRVTDAASLGALGPLLADFLRQRPDVEQRVFDARFRLADTQDSAAARLGMHRITVRRIEDRLKAGFQRYLLRRRAGEAVQPPPRGARPAIPIGLQGRGVLHMGKEETT